VIAQQQKTGARFLVCPFMDMFASYARRKGHNGKWEKEKFETLSLRLKQRRELRLKAEPRS
jgi:hypothetical protein